MKSNSEHPRLVVLSKALPFPGHAGQQRRVRHKLEALRERFHVTFVTAVRPERVNSVRDKLSHFSDQALVLPSRYSQNRLTQLWHRLRGSWFVARTGLKFSNYVIGRLEFPPERITPLLANRHFDLALFEYWHAHRTVAAFQARNIPCILDMHNILWRSYQRQLAAAPWPAIWRNRQLRLYRNREEAAWRAFDGLITINAAEHEYVQKNVPDTMPLFYAPMGIDLSQWPYSWQPAAPPRVIYYGGLGSPHNQRDARRCYEGIMPLVWQQFPDAELWLVGSNPPDDLRSLAEQDKRVQVTGFVDVVQEVLKMAALVLCPWTGKYGFRSRLVEVMALGVPVVTTPDAVYGMKLQEEEGLLLGETDVSLAHHVLRILSDEAFATAQSQNARRQIEELYSFPKTYGRLAYDLAQWLSDMPNIQ